MENKKVYLVFYGKGLYDDYGVYHQKKVYRNKERAEQAKKLLEDGYKSYDFPLDWCTADDYDTSENLERMSQEEAELVDIWYDQEYKSYEFGSAWIEELELIDYE